MANKVNQSKSIAGGDIVGNDKITYNINITNSYETDNDNKKDELPHKGHWVIKGSNKEITNNELIKSENTVLQIDGNIARAEVAMPDGNKIYAEYDFNTGAVLNWVTPYPIKEYSIDIPPEIIVNKEEGVTVIKEVRYYAEKYTLKFGGLFQSLYDLNTRELIDVDVKAPCGMRIVRNDIEKKFSIIDSKDIKL